MDNQRIILVVDDDVDHLSLVERYVEVYGLQCIAVTSASEAKKHLKSEKVSVLVTDMVMPEIDGMELLTFTKEHHPYVDVIVMTGFSQQYSYVDVIEAGATDFIAKPFRKDEFAAKLDRLFREKTLLNELTEAKEHAEAGGRAKTAFLCTISHELMTPMNGLLGFINILKDSDLPEKEAEYVQIISQSSQRLMKLINQILDFSRLETGSVNISPSHFLLTDIFDELIFSTKRDADSKKLVLNININDSLSKTLLFCDKLIVKHILYILLENAIKFTDAGSVNLQVKKISEKPGDIVHLDFSIQDSGCGIDPEKQALIFEPFTQVEDYMTRKCDGAGLGLAMCSRLVDLVNGKLTVKNNPSGGSTFCFTVEMKAV